MKLTVNVKAVNRDQIAEALYAIAASVSGSQTAWSGEGAQTTAGMVERRYDWSLINQPGEGHTASRVEFNAELEERTIKTDARIT